MREERAMDPERHFGDRGAHGAADARVLGAPRREAPGLCPRSATAGSQPRPGRPSASQAWTFACRALEGRMRRHKPGSAGLHPEAAASWRRPRLPPCPACPRRHPPIRRLGSRVQTVSTSRRAQGRGFSADTADSRPAGRPAPREGPGVQTRDRALAVLGLAEPALCLCLRCRLPPLESAGQRRGF